MIAWMLNMYENTKANVAVVAVAITEAQRLETLEMDWLIEDIARNGVATAVGEASARPVPEYSVAVKRDRAGERRGPVGWRPRSTPRWKNST